MRRLTGLFIFVSGMGLAGAAIAQQPQPQPTQTGGIQPLPPPPATTSASALPLPTIAPPPPPPTVTASATVTAPPPPTVTATVPPPPPPPPTATATTTEQLPPPPPPTATTTAPPPTTTAPPPPPPVMVVPPPKNSLRRDDGEMAFLYATSAAFGLVTGTWIDTLSLCSPDNKQKNSDGTIKIDPVTNQSINQCDPAGALVSPLLLGTLFPLGFFLWDNFYKGGIHRGVPSSISTGMIIGALEGLGVAGANFAIAGPPVPPATDGNRWGSTGIMTSVWVGAALGGIGGYAFGEAVRPDPRKIALIASGAGWGALMGSTFGGGVANSDGNSVAQGMLVGNLVGINVGVLTTGVLAAVGYDPSWSSLKYMWLGAGIGLLGTSAIIYPIYLATGQQDQTMNCGDPNSSSGRHGCPLVNHGMVANSFGMLAGVVIAGILTRDMKDPEPVPVPENTAPPPPGSPNGPPNGPPPPTGPTAKREKPAWRPPFMFSVSPTQNGGMVGISGQW